MFSSHNTHVLAAGMLDRGFLALCIHKLCFCETLWSTFMVQIRTDAPGKDRLDA